METELISSQLAIAYATSSLLEWLKSKSWFPMMQANTAQLNRYFAAVAAFVTAIGIHMVTDWQATDGVLTITISGLSATSIVHGLFAWIQQFAMQQGAYKLLVKETKPETKPEAKP